jgi:PAB-dependent poly(A)-specific ribonuclease subunit 2
MMQQHELARACLDLDVAFVFSLVSLLLLSPHRLRPLTSHDEAKMTQYNPLHLLPLPPHPQDPKPFATALTLDPFSDLLWIGTSSGHVSALCSPVHLTPNVRFPAHGYQPNAFLGGGMGRGVKRIRVTDREVWTLTEGGMGGRKRGGAPKWNVSDPTRGLRSMSPNPINSHEALAGGLNGILVANTSRGEVVRRVSRFLHGHQLTS